jgi:AraC family transcriptional regulator
MVLMTLDDSFHAASLQSHKAPHATLTERAYPGSTKTPRHFHEFALLSTVLEGGFQELVGGKVKECRPGTVLFQGAGEHHMEEFGAGGARCLYIQIEPAWIDQIKGATGVSNDGAIAVDKGELLQLGRRLHGEFIVWDEVSSLCVEGLILEIMAGFTRFRHTPQLRAPIWLQRAREIIRESFSSPYTLTTIAEAVEIHPVHLAQSFRRFYGCSAGAYIRQLRIEFACNKLSSSEEPLADIALRAGFSDQSHFTKSFKQVYGLSPAKYRQLTREERSYLVSGRSERAS